MTDNSENTEWKLGQVKFFDNDKGFGFLECWDDRKDYFVHVSRIETEPLDDYDYVVFKLGPSRKKPGTLEARNVFLLAKFLQDPRYLQEQFLKYSDETFRKIVLQAISVNDLINLLEIELASLKSIENEKYFSEITRVTKFYKSLKIDETLKNQIDSKISTSIDQIASPEIKIKLWLDDLLKKQPDDTTLQVHFKASEKKDRLIIFKKANSLSRKWLIQKWVSECEPFEALDFVVDHLKQVNKLSYNTDLKSKLFESGFWSDKIDYNIFETVAEYLEGTLDDNEKLPLFLSGYLNTISFDFLFELCLELTKEDIEHILNRKVLSELEAFQIVEKLLAREIEYFESEDNIPSREFVNSASDEEWNKYFINEAEPFKWILKISKTLSENEASKIESIIIEKMPGYIQVELWESGFLNQISLNILSNSLKDTSGLQSKINKWLTGNKITEEDVINILKSNITDQEPIKTRNEYYFLNYHILALANLNVDVVDLERIVNPSNLSFYRLALWLEGKSSEFYFDEFKSIFVFLSSDHQIRFLKKLFWLAQNRKFGLTVENLRELTRIDFDIYRLNQIHNPEVPLDISVDIVIEAIKSFSENRKFLLDSDLLKIVLKDLSSDKTHKFKIRSLFEKCTGRYEAKFNWNRNGEVRRISFGDNRFYYAIQFEYDVRLVEEVRKLPGRKWNQDEQHWGVPSQYENEVMRFARENRFLLNLGGNKFENNAHFAELRRTEIPKGIIFCEGRLAKKKDQTFNREFWWCTNQPCFGNCETLHESDRWQEYTLLDFLTILGLDLGDGNRVGDHIEKGKYYQFISTINRFNRLLDKMYCEECDNILFPIEDSNFAHYRVVRFHCENKNCSQQHKEIYLHHCLNGKCGGIIDSRISKKCPNGLYICSNENCGCCCSHDMMSRRLANLQITGGYIHENLKYAVENRLGHLERAQHFCYHCGELMDESGDEIFYCQGCSIQYDVSKNNFKRPHRHSKIDEKTGFTNLPLNNFDEDDEPF
jgi:cold shock CspA family protein